MHVLLDPARRPVIGHRGNRAHAPENTLESFRQAMRLGADAIECDVHRSRDGIPVVIHDPTLERTTDGTGAVRDRTIADLRRLDAGARFTVDDGRTFPYAKQGITIPTLEEVLAATAPLPVLIEIKTVEAASAALRVIQHAGAQDRVLMGSFLDEALAPFRDAGIPVGAGTATLTRLYLAACLRRTRRSLPFDAVAIPRFHHGLPIPVLGFARMLRAVGGTTHVWTVNARRVARRLWAGGVNGIISDDPGAMLAERGGPA